MEENKNNQIDPEYRMKALEEEAEEYQKSVKRRKKRMVKAFLWIGGAALFLVLLSLGLQKCSDDLQDDRLIYSYDPLSEDWGDAFFQRDIDHDIFEDENFKDISIRMEYKKGGISDSVDIYKKDLPEPQMRLFCEYFKAAVAGDGKALNGLFTEDYFENNGRGIERYPDKFRMQKIYNISVSHVSTIASEGTLSGTYTVERYVVEFYLLENTGDFRPDLPEPDEYTTIPLLFEVITVDETSVINRIFQYIDG